jgi:uncharacterized membrane protein YozB (DUF420 family)
MPAPLASTLNLGLQIVVLAVLLIAIPFAKKETKEGFRTHERLMATAIVLNLVGVILVMIPSLIAYLSIGLASIPTIVLVLELPHGTFGFLGLVFGIAFVLNKKPKNLKRIMDLTALFWLIAIILGFMQYLYIASLP